MPKVKTKVSQKNLMRAHNNCANLKEQIKQDEQLVRELGTDKVIALGALKKVVKEKQNDRGK